MACYIRLSIATRYKRGVAGEVESELVLADYLDGRDWDKMIAGRDFVFFQVCI